MSRFLLVITLTLATIVGHSQQRLPSGTLTELFYFSIQGNWDKQKDPSRAQFGGNNKLITTYFGNFNRDLMMSGSDKFLKAVTGEISFLINVDGGIDSIKMVKKTGQPYDITVLKIIASMSGKWRAGQKDGAKQPEQITLWYSVYRGGPKKKDLTEDLAKASKYLEDKNYEKAIKYSEEALEYDELNVDAVILKSKAMQGLNQTKEACDLLRTFEKYNSEKIISALKEYCN